MNPREPFEDIESNSFAALLSAASDFKTFLHAAMAQNAVRDLKSSATASSSSCIRIAARALRLAHRLGDPRYESRWDSALTIYLWLLLETADDALARIVAESLVSRAQLWWARKLALHVLAEARYVSSAGDKEQDIGATSPSVLFNNDAGEFMLAAPTQPLTARSFLTATVRHSTEATDFVGATLNVSRTIVDAVSEAA